MAINQPTSAPGSQAAPFWYFPDAHIPIHNDEVYRRIESGPCKIPRTYDGQQGIALRALGIQETNIALQVIQQELVTPLLAAGLIGKASIGMKIDQPTTEAVERIIQKIRGFNTTFPEHLISPERFKFFEAKVANALLTEYNPIAKALISLTMQNLNTTNVKPATDKLFGKSGDQLARALACESVRRIVADVKTDIQQGGLLGALLSLAK